MNYSSLGKYYDDLFQMSYQHGFPISELMVLLPFERDLMIQMVNQHLASKAEMERLEQLRNKDLQGARPRF